MSHLGPGDPGEGGDARTAGDAPGEGGGARAARAAAHAGGARSNAPVFLGGNSIARILDGVKSGLRPMFRFQLNALYRVVLANESLSTSAPSAPSALRPTPWP